MPGGAQRRTQSGAGLRMWSVFLDVQYMTMFRTCFDPEIIDLLQASSQKNHNMFCFVFTVRLRRNINYVLTQFSPQPSHFVKATLCRYCTLKLKLQNNFLNTLTCIRENGNPASDTALYNFGCLPVTFAGCHFPS